jgi:hypothetical protein
VTAVLASTVTGQEIPSELLRPILPHPFSSIQHFSLRATRSYVFAEIYTGLDYTGLDTDVSQITGDDLQMADLLRWTNGISLPTGIPTDTLGQIVWLEKNLLHDIETHQKRDSWVLLAFSLLSNMVTSNSWPACCIAAVRLAVLSRQYPLYDTAEWDGFVAGLMNQYIQLVIDPLGQACLAYLCLTTSDPQATMTRNLPGALSGIEFDASVRIPELVSRLDSRDVASAQDNGSLNVVIVRRQHRDVVFSRIRNTNDWSFSVHPVELSTPADAIRRLTWGPRPEQSVDVNGRSSLWRYFCTHYRTSVNEFMQTIDERNLALLARIMQGPAD